MTLDAPGDGSRSDLCAEVAADVVAAAKKVAPARRSASPSATVRMRSRIAVALSLGRAAAGNGRRGVGGAAGAPAACEPPPTLELLEVDAAVTRLQAISGKGSQAARREALAELFSRATEPEQRLLVGLFLGELRQGALEGVMTDAVARAAGLPVARVRRAAMLAGDLRAVAAVAMREGAAGPRAVPAHAAARRSRRCWRRPLTTSRARSGRLGRGGDRVEARRRPHPGAPGGSEVRVFTRNLADITDRVPEIVSRRASARRAMRSSSTARRSRFARTGGPSRSRSR